MASQIIDFPHDNSWKESFDKDSPSAEIKVEFEFEGESKEIGI